MTQDYWFKPKTYGFGAQPTCWQGWLATIVFGLTCVVWVRLHFFNENPSVLDWVAFIAGLIVLIAGFTMLAKKKTDGAWRWRWGKKDQE
jgi:hypothetical protein